MWFLNVLIIAAGTKILKNFRNMSTFMHRNNPITGRSEWELVREDYDYHQEVARAAYADMLHDSSRNRLYYDGLRAAIAAKHANGEEAHVLDIGTGTGLLSMMAARCGADSIVACEAFDPMARCAKQVIELNGLSDRITVVGKRSTEMKVGEDMPRRANILVTEVFDTELIGEGAVGTFSHAHQHLLEPGSIVVPSSATVYAQLVEGDLFHKWLRLEPIKDQDDSTLIKVPPTMNECPGSSVVHDVQLGSMEKHEFKGLTPAIPVMEFDWSNPDIPKNRNEIKSIIPIECGKTCGLFMWWDLKMDPLGEIILSCAPSWTGNVEWRDHWIQAIYYLPQKINITKNQEIKLHTCHDEYSFWFYTDANKPQLTLPYCDKMCGLHQSISFTRLGNINDPLRRESYLKALKSKVNTNTKALVTGDETLLSSLIKKLGAKEVFTSDTSTWTKEVASYNDLSLNYIQKDDINEDLGKELTLLCSEPNYNSAILPWYNLAFWYLRSELKLNQDVTIMPCSATIWAMPVELEHLWKIRAPLGEVEGFAMKPFDDLVEISSEISDSPVEPQPLWEYTNFSLGQPMPLISFDFREPISSKIATEGTLMINSSGCCHAVALWMIWNLDETTKVSSGPTLPPRPGHRVIWDKHTRQGLYLLRPYTQVKPDETLTFSTLFQPDNGHIEFNFKIDQK